jgi:hypothetical protein
MSDIRSEEAQSFLLRFWFERSLFGVGHWRGTLWDQRQDPDDSARPVADPEEAFALVRLALMRVTPEAVPMRPSRLYEFIIRDCAARGLSERLACALRYVFGARP